ncbi:hypothetical protein [Gemmatimonas sp.]
MPRSAQLKAVAEPLEAASRGQLPAERATGRVRIVRRVAIHVAAATAALLALPMATLQWKSASLHDFSIENAVQRVAEVDQVRQLRVPANPSVSPVEAGAALQALLPVRSTDNFPAKATVPIAWPSAKLTPTMFSELRTPLWWGPNASTLITRVATHVSAEELAFLETMANLPVWALLDRAALAAHADVLGGRFELPLAANANLVGMPVPRFGDVRTLAHASVVRAAYYVARKDYVRAEAVLRNAASVALLLVDDAPFIIDALMGRAMLGIVTEGLGQLYTITGNTAGATTLRGFREQIKRRSARGGAGDGQVLASSLQGTRQQLLASIANPALPRSVRFEHLQMLQWSTCGSPLEALTGSSPDVDAAFDEAQRTLVRTEAERQYLDRMRHMTNGAEWHAQAGTPLGLVAASAQVVSAVTGRPQLATCTRMLAGMR